MSTTTTTDAEGDVISTSVGSTTASVKFARSLNDGNYGTESCDLFLTLDVTDETPDELEARLKATVAFAKTIVYAQLGVESALDDSGIVRAVGLPVAAPKAGGKSGKSAAPAASAPAAGGKPDKDAMWQNWIDSPNEWFDNREDKRNPKAPDFKHKRGGPFDGQGLWVDKAPAFAVLVLEGNASAA